MISVVVCIRFLQSLLSGASRAFQEDLLGNCNDYHGDHGNANYKGVRIHLNPDKTSKCKKVEKNGYDRYPCPGFDVLPKITNNAPVNSNVHNQIENYVWSKEDYNNNESLDGSIYKIEVPFAHFKFERLLDLDDSSSTDVQWGFCVDDNRESYIGAPFLFYPIRQTSATQISFRDSTTVHSPLTTYIIPSNSLDLDSTTSKDNINFKNENNEYEGGNEFTDTLFQKYYSNYITDIFNNKNRLTKVTAYLPLKILLNFKLADRFDINGQRYKINSIKTNLKTGKSDIELLNEL